MRVHAQKQNQPQQQASPNFKKSSANPLAASHRVQSIPYLQHTIGNQAVQRLLQADTEGSEVGSSTATSSHIGHDFSLIPLHAKTRAGIQPKLVVNTPGDAYEQEADRVAEQVLHTPDARLQRACACGGECPTCKKKQLSTGAKPAQLKRNPAGEIATSSIVQEVLHSPGQPLDAETRAFFEPRFGHDFSRVRIHNGADAAESARTINAFAYTVGRHIVFGAGQYTPASRAGRELIAHELTHTIQQGEADAFDAREVGEPEDRSENEASRTAREVLRDDGHASPITSDDVGVIRRDDGGDGGAAGDSAAATADSDNVTPEDARRALARRLGEDRLRLLEQRLIGGSAAGEEEAESVGRAVAAGGTAPEIARMAFPLTLQAAGPVLPVVGALAAIALCAFGFYFYALDHYSRKGDKWLHCWTSCKIAAWCAGTSGSGVTISALLGLGKEVVDAICDALGGPCGAEWKDVFADAKGIGCSLIPGYPCSSCCDKVM